MTGRPLLRSLERWTAGIVGGMALASLAFGVGPVLWGVLAGGVVGWLNIEGIARLVAWARAAGGQRAALLALLLPVKLLALAALSYWLVLVVAVDACGFLAGVAGALLALVIASRRQAGARTAAGPKSVDAS